MMHHLIASAMEQQATACAELGSNFTALLLTVMSKHYPASGDVWQMMANWKGDLGPTSASVPLRFAGAVHALVLAGKNAELNALYGDFGQSATDDQLAEIVIQAIDKNSEFVLQFLMSAPQTNEVRRAAILLPAFMEIANRTGLNKLVMSELGASAGLNMIWDQYHYAYGAREYGKPNAAVSLAPEVTGNLPKFTSLNVQARAGCDLNPVDISTAHSVKKLMSYIWADQSDRLVRTNNAIELRRSFPEIVEKADAIDWLRNRLNVQFEKAVHIIYHTIAWQYFPKEKQAQGAALIAAAGAKATHSTPLAWVSFEADGQTPGAALILRIWPSGDEIYLARGDYHGRWINWLI